MLRLGHLSPWAVGRVRAVSHAVFEGAGKALRAVGGPEGEAAQQLPSCSRMAGVLSGLPHVGCQGPVSPLSWLGHSLATGVSRSLASIGALLCSFCIESNLRVGPLKQEPHSRVMV